MKSIRHYINLIESLSEAPLDSKFTSFMNKSLGQKVDTPSDTSNVPNFIKAAPQASLDSLGYKAAFNFGIKTLNKLTPQQRSALAEEGEEGVVDWLADRAQEQGLITMADDEDEPGKFVWEDLDEVQGFFSDIFKDPSITSWVSVLTDGM